MYSKLMWCATTFGRSVPLQSSSRCKLESCLDFFIKEEVLDGDEMPTCSKCKTRRKSTKSFTIQRFPKYLVIRECFDPSW